MTLTNLENAVQLQVRTEADAIEREAREAAEAYWERASARLREEHQRRLDAMKSELHGALERETGTRQTADRLRLLVRKNEIIDSAFREAVEGILSLPDNGYAAWLKSQLARLPKDAPLEIAVNARDRGVIGPLLQELGAPFTLAETPASIQGGFLARGGNRDLDYSLNALMGVVRESMAEEVAMRLFGEERGS